ncbi:hypothetical protein [Halorussus halophilus]|uniref:hypothetical protein n=1 Tax=Halorussus halophilus TaxID=2650975 RepID=UPI001301388B|nr:hypothetical protein [Halorussus halophilus]
MRTALHRIAAGALAYVVSYLLVGLATVTRIDNLLTLDSATTIDPIVVYQSAGNPVWQAIGWFTLNAHGVPVTIANETGNVVAAMNFVHHQGAWLGVIQGSLGLLPMLACLLVGLGVTLRSCQSPVPLSVGAYMTLGYLLAVFASTVVFSGTVGPIDASFALPMNIRSTRWFIFVLLTPLVFGSVGAFLGRSPVFESAFERLAPE